MRYLILGGGPAGIAAAKVIRKKEKEAVVIIATEEAESLYMRPLLADFISGDMDISALADPQGKNLESKGIEIRRGKRARKVDSAGNRVIFDNGAEEAYDFLLVATGGKPVLPVPLERSPEAVVPLDSLNDAKRIRERANRPGPVIVYGPGYVGIEACRALAKLGKEVIWIKPDLPRFGYPFSGELEASVLDRVRNRGVQIREGDDIAAIRKVDDGVFEVRDLEGQDLRCSTVVAATERLPAVDFLKGSGVKVGTGVVVDDYLRTSIANIFAAGDCAEMIDRKTREIRINFGWRSAILQGELAGENMAGGEKRYMRKQEDYLWLLFGPSLLDRQK
jgi:nitrite reductase (NADH) large subunit